MIPPERIFSHYLIQEVSNTEAVYGFLLLLDLSCKNQVLVYLNAIVCIKSTILTMEFLKHMMTAASCN